MAEQQAPAHASVGGVEATYKARDLEGFLDIHFYRPVGYALARLFAALDFSPSGVSLAGAICGVLAGHLYFYQSLAVNVAGMALHILTNALDNADGQLARMTGSGSLIGAITDGAADYVVFLSVYVHLCLRHMDEGGSAAVWLLAALAGGSHALQSMMIDYYRNGYLQFVAGKQSADANASENVRAAYDAAAWSNPLKKLGLRNYLQYVRRQEALAPELRQLRLATQDCRPDWLAEIFRNGCRPLVKWCNMLATNPRMLLLFAFLLIGRPLGYFIVEATVMNALLAFVMIRHRDVFLDLLRRLSRASTAV